MSSKKKMGNGEKKMENMDAAKKLQNLRLQESALLDELQPVIQKLLDERETATAGRAAAVVPFDKIIAAIDAKLQIYGVTVTKTNRRNGNIERMKILIGAGKTKEQVQEALSAEGVQYASSGSFSNCYNAALGAPAPSRVRK